MKINIQDITKFHSENNSKSDPEYISKGLSPSLGGKNLLPQKFVNLQPSRKQQLNPLNIASEYQKMIASGNNEEHVWLNVKASQNQKYNNDPDEIDIESLQGINPLHGVKTRTKQEIQEEVRAENEMWERMERGEAITNNQIVDDYNETESDEIKDEYSLFNLQDNEFILFIDKEFVFKTESELSIIKVIEEVVTTHNVDLERLTLLKNIPFSFGVKLA